MILMNDFGVGIGYFLFGIGLGMIFGIGGYWVLQQLLERRNQFIPHDTTTRRR